MSDANKRDGKVFWTWIAIGATICGGIGAYLFVSLKRSDFSSKLVVKDASIQSLNELKANAVEVKPKTEIRTSSKSISMAGIIQPEGGIIKIDIPSNDRHYKTLVNEGDIVKPNQPLLYLESFLKLKAQGKYIESYYKNLNQFKDCSKPSKKESEASLAISNSSVYSSNCLQSLSLEQAQNIRVNELPRLQASIVSINSQIEASIVRAPRVAKILKVFRNPEPNKTAMYLGDTRSMFVSARLLSSDYPYIEEGQTCNIVSPAFGDIEVTGKLTGIGKLIRDSYFDIAIKIDNAEAISDFSNLEVIANCNTASEIKE